MSEPVEIFHGSCFSVWSDNTVFFYDNRCDWVGKTDKEETHQLYLALKSLFEKESQ
jgi:hypothetical protein